jgi:hypothetical protein
MSEQSFRYFNQQLIYEFETNSPIFENSKGGLVVEYEILITNDSVSLEMSLSYSVSLE